jgi:hypothetical protein
MQYKHFSTPMVRQTRMRTRLAVVLAIAISPFSGGVEASYIKSNTVTAQCAGQCSYQEFRVKTKASPVQELIKVLLNMQ